MKRFSALLLMISVIGACTTAEPMIEPGAAPDAFGLVEVTNVRLDEVRIKPGLDLSTYDKIIIDDVLLDYTQERNEYQLRGRDRERLIEAFRTVFSREIESSSGLTLVESSGPNTLRLSLSVSDLSINVSQDQARAVMIRVFGRTSGELAIQGTLTDSVSTESLVSFADSEVAQTMEFERITAMSIRTDFRQIMNRWANIVSAGIQTARSLN